MCADRRQASLGYEPKRYRPGDICCRRCKETCVATRGVCANRLSRSETAGYCWLCRRCSSRLQTTKSAQRTRPICRRDSSSMLSLYLKLPAQGEQALLTVEPLGLSINASLRRAGMGYGSSSAEAPPTPPTPRLARGQSGRDARDVRPRPRRRYEAMAARLGARQSHLAVLLRLSYRSPEIVRAILAGQQPGRADADAPHRPVETSLGGGQLQGPARNPRKRRASPPQQGATGDKGN